MSRTQERRNINKKLDKLSTMIQTRGVIEITPMGKHIQTIVHTKNLQSYYCRRFTPRTLIKNLTITNHTDDKADTF